MILQLADGLKKVGEKYNVTASQVALAWLLAQGDDIIPIPGTTKIHVSKEILLCWISTHVWLLAARRESWSGQSAVEPCRFERGAGWSRACRYYARRQISGRNGGHAVWWHSCTLEVKLVADWTMVQWSDMPTKHHQMMSTTSSDLG